MNACSPIDATKLEIVAEVKLKQLANASLPMKVTNSGMSIEDRERQITNVW